MIYVMYLGKFKTQSLKRSNNGHIENSEKYVMKLFGGMNEK